MVAPLVVEEIGTNSRVLITVENSNPNALSGQSSARTSSFSVSVVQGTVLDSPPIFGSWIVSIECVATLDSSGLLKEVFKSLLELLDSVENSRHV